MRYILLLISFLLAGCQDEHLNKECVDKMVKQQYNDGAIRSVCSYYGK